MENTKQFIKPEQSSSLPPLYKDGVVYPDSKEQAYILNEFFCKPNHTE